MRHHPAVIGAVVAVSGPCGVNHSVQEQQCGALLVSQRYEAGGLNHYRATRPLGAIGYVQGVQAVDVLVSGFFRISDQVDGAGHRIDYRSSSDAKLPNHSAADIRRGNRTREADLPERDSRLVVGIKSVEAIVRRSHEQNIVKALTGNMDSR